MSVNQIADALKGGPKSCPHCHKDMPFIKLKKEYKVTEPGYYYHINRKSYYLVSKKVTKTIEQFICPHCDANVSSVVGIIRKENREASRERQRNADKFMARQYAKASIKPPRAIDIEKLLVSDTDEIDKLKKKARNSPIAVF